MANAANMQIEAGQIWEINVANGRVGKVIIIACQTNFANTLAIWEDDIPSNFRLAVGGSVDTRRLAYTNYDNLRCMIDYVGQTELDQIKSRLADSIGLNEHSDRETDDSTPENIRLILAERERDIWKNVAMNLMK